MISNYKPLIQQQFHVEENAITGMDRKPRFTTREAGVQHKALGWSEAELQEHVE
jgi:hypothetical protein